MSYLVEVWFMWKYNWCDHAREQQIIHCTDYNMIVSFKYKTRLVTGACEPNNNKQNSMIIVMIPLFSMPSCCP